MDLASSVGVGLFAMACASWQWRQRSRRLRYSTMSKRKVEERTTLRMKQAVITRIYGGKSLENALAGPLKDFLQSVDSYSDLIVICIGSNSLQSLSDFETKFQQYIGSLELDPNKVKLLPIYPWGRFVTALNVALRHVLDEESYRRVIFQSLEFLVDRKVILTLSDFMENHENAIVVGPVMNGHLFAPGTNPLAGRTCPWNTCAMWDLEKLYLLGFPMIGDGLLDKGSETGGVEEVSAIALLQRLRPHWTAHLLAFPPEQSSWNVNFADPARALYHEKKMESKNSRPKAHLDLLQLEGAVEHATIAHDAT